MQLLYFELVFIVFFSKHVSCFIPFTKPKNFKRAYGSKGQDEISLAVDMLEQVIADTAAQMVELELDTDFAIASFFDTLHKEEIAEARAAKARAEEKAAEDRVMSIEEFDGDYEANERKRDMAVYHASHDLEDFEIREMTNAARDESEKLIQEYDTKKQLSELKTVEDVLKGDLKDFQKIVRDQLRKEWEQQKKEQKT